ncbi:MAG: biopolymer transporter ExbD [Saprospiraceae bacterium]
MSFASLNDDDSNEALAEINMIPLIDVMLVLLVIFIVTAPLLTHAVKVDLPKASSAPNLTKPDNVQVAIDGAGQVYWNGESGRRRRPRPNDCAPPPRCRRSPNCTCAPSAATPYEKVAEVMSAAGARRPDPYRLRDKSRLPNRRRTRRRHFYYPIIQPASPSSCQPARTQPTRTHMNPKTTRCLLSHTLLLLGSTSLPALAQEAAKELPTVSVQADTDKPDGYRATSTRVGKVLQDPHDIPQAVTTHHRHADGRAAGRQPASEALRNVSGLSFNSAEGGRSGDNMNLRGFYTFGDIYLDGIRDTAQYNRETFNYEQIDVLRGAGAMLFGRGQAGGVINQVSKTPLRIEQYKLTGSVGDYGYREFTADLNKPINSDTALRINAMQRDEGSWRSNPASGAEPEIHRKGLAFSLALNQRGDHRFWLNHYILSTNDNPDYGISFDGATKRPGTSSRFSPDTFWGADRTFDKSDTRITTLVHEYRISADSQLRTQLRSADYERSYWARTPSLTVAPSANGSLCTAPATCNGGPTRISDYETVTLQSDYSTKFKAAGMKHELLAGVEYLKENIIPQQPAQPRRHHRRQPALVCPLRREHGGNGRCASTRIPTPSTRRTPSSSSRAGRPRFGLRRDQMDAKYSSATSPKLSYGENSLRAALSFHPAEDTHYYLGWSDSFSPTADLYQLTVTPAAGRAQRGRRTRRQVAAVRG